MTPPHIQTAFDLALQHHRAGRFAEAEALYRQILSLQPNHLGALQNLGLLATLAGHHAAAVELLGRAVAARPDNAVGLNNLATALMANGQLDEAITACRKATSFAPGLVGAHYNLGSALLRKGQLDPAIAAFEAAIGLDPRMPELHFNLGIALRRNRQISAAASAYRQALALRPNYAQALYDLGNLMGEAGELDQAIDAYRLAITHRPDYAEAYSNLGNMLQDKGQLDEAIAAFEQAIALNPSLPVVHTNLGNALQSAGRLDEAVEVHRRAVAINPGIAQIHSNYLCSLNYSPSMAAETVAREHFDWNTRHARGLMQLSHTNDRRPDRQLRIGYVSPDFREHAAARMILPLLQHHDRRGFRIYCYSQVANPDEMTSRFRAASDEWRDLTTATDDQAAAIIRADQIDILVDLAGHTADHRLLVFARKPAPVQITWLGYPNTTGGAAIDYRITDALADPPGLTEHLHSEQLLRLPRTNWIWQPPENAPEPDSSAIDGPIQFGCFNNFSKVTQSMLSMWARILAAIPGSTLLLKANALTVPSAQQRVHNVFKAEGISPSRVRMASWKPSAAEHLSMYDQVSVALDPHPYNGTATTFEALWMGVPVITLAGQTHVSRVGASLLTNLGLTELVAANPEDYVKIATRLASDLPRLSHLHATMRRRFQQSPLMDFPRFATDVESLYRRVWHKWCQE